MSLLFYDDSPVFGGHEVMALAGLEATLRSTSRPIVFLAAHSNEKLLAKLAEIATRHSHLTITPIPWQSSRFEAIRHRLKPARIRILAEMLKQHAPQLIVAIQGNIEHSSLALHAAKLACIRCASYIPVPHTNEQMGAKLGKFRDLFCQNLFSLPHAFITITDEMAKMLQLRGATAPIHVVYNGIDTQRFQHGDTTSARRLLSLPLEPCVLGVIGRIEFRQKQQHRLIEAVASDPYLASQCYLVFAGDGPDAASIKSLLNAHSLRGSVLPWCDTAPLYQALDALVIPSRYEGLPLVMLEALASSTSVFGSDRDGMKDLLPAERRFNPDDPTSLAKTLSTWMKADRPAPDPALVGRVRETMSLQAFGDSFYHTIDQLSQSNSCFP
jgi:glycosyltransferase involved in cell wall biosynthesis